MWNSEEPSFGQKLKKLSIGGHPSIDADWEVSYNFFFSKFNTYFEGDKESELARAGEGKRERE